MAGTGKFRRDRMIAATVALVVNGLIAWQLQDLLRSAPASLDEAAEALQVVWIVARPARDDVALAGGPWRPATRNRSPVVIAAPVSTPAAPEERSNGQPADPVATRPMAAVYLQQARQWAAHRPEPTTPRDPFANRPVALAQQAKSRFRLSRIAPADVVAGIGVLFAGSGYTTDGCGAIDDRVLGLVVAGDGRSVQQDLEYERRNCRR